MVPDHEPWVRVNEERGKWLVAPHWPFKPVLLSYVKREMASRGHCLVRAVRERHRWFAIEGSHRIWAASKLGVVVTIQPVERTYLVQHDNPELGIVTAGSIVDVGPEIRGPTACYRIER
jgi:hypothetical protein